MISADSFANSKLSRSLLRKGKPINLQRKRSLRRLTNMQRRMFSLPDETYLSFANFRHHGQWWVGHLKIEGLESVRVVYESFKWGPIRAEHRYIKFQMKPGFEVTLSGQESTNFGQTVKVDSLLFSPEGVAVDEQIRFFPSILPYYSAAYCFRSGEYLDRRFATEGVTLTSRRVHLSQGKQEDLLRNCIHLSVTRAEKDSGHIFYNCGVVVYRELMRVNDLEIKKESIFSRVAHHVRIIMGRDHRRLYSMGVSQILCESYR